MLNQLTDRFIDVDFYDADDRVVFSIRTPKTGRRPEITLSSELIPEGSCYKTVLTITNMGVDQWDIRKWKYMVIVAGYRNSMYSKFEVPLLTAYIPDSPPDQHTVFSGLAVGKVNGLLDTGMLNLIFDGDKLTWGEVIEGCLNAVGATGKNAYVRISEETRQTEITFNGMSCYAENGISVLEWLQRELTSWGRRVGKKFLVTAFNTDVKVIEIEGNDKVPFSVENVIHLTYVTNVSFTAALLQATTVWIPNLLPGTMFEMDSVFYDQSNTPNEVKVEDYIDPNNYYRVITSSITFSTNGENSMSIKAISNAAMSGLVLDTQAAMNNVSTEQKDTEKKEKPPKEVHIGIRRKSRTSSDIYNMNLPIPSMKKSYINEYTSGKSITSNVWYFVCEKIFGYVNKPVLNKWEDNAKAICDSYHTVTGSYINPQSVKGMKDNFRNTQLWVVLSYLHYRYALQIQDTTVLEEMDSSVVGVYQNIVLGQDTTLYVPQNLNYTQLRQYKDIFKHIWVASKGNFVHTTLVSKECALAIYCYLDGVAG